MSLPAPFVESALEALRPLTRRRGFEPVNLARCAVGKAARVVSLVLCVGSLVWKLPRRSREEPEAPEGMVAAAWFCALLQGGSASESIFPLERCSFGYVR